MTPKNLPETPSQPRKGHVRLKDIPPELIARLNRGELETATLSEQCALDIAELIESLEGWAGDHAGLLRSVQQIRSQQHGIVARMRLTGEAAERHGAFDDHLALRQLMTHRSDTLRALAGYAIAAHPKLDLAEKLAAIRPLAADAHFGVREWAWLALRPSVAAALESALDLLRTWVTDGNPNLRRFAVEITRPRGVWTKHIPRLLETPHLGLPLLEPCNRDPSRYVQDSVANWLNDAAKSQPQWVRRVCADWLERQPDSPYCRYIVRRAQRSIG
jgi:3-methyladenine DNA glycosylase AlkC